MEAGFLEAKTQLRKSITALIEKKKQETSMFSAEEIQSGAHERDIMSKFLSVQGEDRFSEEQLVFVVYVRTLTLLAHFTNPRNSCGNH